MDPLHHKLSVERAKQFHAEHFSHPENLPAWLSSDLEELLTPFLRENLKTFCAPSVMSFINRLKDAFTDALKLRAQVSLRDELAWRWVNPDNKFDEQTMGTECLYDPRVEAKVQLCLFPALVCRVETSHPNEVARETTMVHAVVTLKQ